MSLYSYSRTSAPGTYESIFRLLNFVYKLAIGVLRRSDITYYVVSGSGVCTECNVLEFPLRCRTRECFAPFYGGGMRLVQTLRVVSCLPAGSSPRSTGRHLGGFRFGAHG